MYTSFSLPQNIQDEQKLYVWGTQDGELGKWAKSEEFYMQKGDKYYFRKRGEKYL